MNNLNCFKQKMLHFVSNRWNLLSILKETRATWHTLSIELYSSYAKSIVKKTI